MSSDFTNHILRRQYLAHKGEDLLSQVHRVICLVTPNGFVSAGFHPSGEVLIVNSSLLKAQHWNASFIEHEFINEPLLAAPELIKSVFVAATKNIIIPNELYENETIAAEWLSKIFFCEENETIATKEITDCAQHTCFSFPQSVVEIFEKYTADLKILPLNLVHFKNSINAGNLLQCTITDSHATGTLHHNNLLHWHQTFEYGNAEDIAHRLASACTHFGIDVQNYPINCTTTSVEHQIVLKKLQQYLPTMNNKMAGISEIIAPEWSATIHLFQQLNVCG